MRTTCPRRIRKGWARALPSATRSSAAASAPRDIDYINLHGTASQKNDEVEARIVAELFPARTHASSTKGWMGHTLGAAGIVEAVITLLALESGFMPGTLNSRELDAACGPQIRLENGEGDVRHALSNSFGFGGSNCVLLFGRTRAAMTVHELFIEGVGFWASRLPGWDIARDILRGHRSGAGNGGHPARRRLCCRPPNGAARRIPWPSRSKWLRARAKAPGAIPSRCRACSPPRTGISIISDAICDTLAKTPSLTSPYEVSQLRAQRRGGVLDHRHGLH